MEKQRLRISAALNLAKHKISLTQDVIACRISAAVDVILCRISAALDVKACRIFARLGRQTLQNFCSIRHQTMQNFCSTGHQTLQNFCITVSNTMSNKNEKKNRLNILRVKIKDFVVPFLNVQSIMCTLTRVNNQHSKKLNICKSKMHLHLTLRWIIQNFALLKHIFRENWSILLLLHRRNFRVFSGIVLLWGQHFTLSGKKHDIFRNRYEKYV